MLFPVVERDGSRVKGPVLFGYGDCRTCSFVTNLCSDDKYEHCEYAWRKLRELGKETFCELTDEEWDELTLSTPCCWECPKLYDCLKRYIEEWVIADEDRDKIVREMFGVKSYELLFELVREMREMLGVEQGDRHEG